MRVSSTVRWSMWRTGSGRSGSSSSTASSSSSIEISTSTLAGRCAASSTPATHSTSRSTWRMPKVSGNAIARMKPETGHVASMIVSAKTLPTTPAYTYPRRPIRSTIPIKPSMPADCPQRDAESAHPREQESAQYGQRPRCPLRPDVEMGDLVGPVGVTLALAELLEQAAGIRPQGGRHGDREEVDCQQQHAGRQQSGQAHLGHGEGSDCGGVGRTPGPPCVDNTDRTRPKGFSRPQAASTSPSRRRIAAAVGSSTSS